MTECMTHRGPDDEGVFADGSITLAFRRLAILDLTDAGHQPMHNADGSLTIVFNGEIYNYRELRERLDGYSFVSDTDTEVLLHLYEEYGTDCLSMLRGMFAFAIWDADRERLLLARDRLGQKPLFYHRSDERLVFGSTVRSVLADDRIQAVPDQAALREYLTYQYVPHPRTGFEDIKQVAPGEFMIVDGDGVERHRYWQLAYADQLSDSPRRLADRLRDELEEATRLRMRSDVPVGVFLSGGIDSSIVTGLMAEESERPIETYAIGFDEYDELDAARTVAEEFETNHHEYTVTPDALEVLPEIVEQFEMPFGDPSAVPTYYVSKVASRDITVALGGDAGDENFAGYDRYTYDRITDLASRLPPASRSFGSAALSAVPGEGKLSTTARRVAKVLENASGDPVERYAPYICHMLSQEAESVWEGPRPGDELAALRSAYEQADGDTRLDRILETDVVTYLPDDLLVKIDRASMAHSLEARSPFLDHRVVEFAARIPSKYKWRRGSKKWILKRAYKDFLPDSILERPKQGFGVPVDAWFRGGLRSYARERLDRLGSRPAFDRAGIDDRLTAHLDGTGDYGYHLWDLVVLEQWYETFID